MSSDAAPPAVGRVLALGASNLTRGLHVVLATARDTWGADVELVAALGLGRSYALRSRVLVRTLPGILESGLWPALERLPPRPARALIADVGNDILYGASVSQILAWVEECVTRLERFARDIVITDLPLASIRRLSPAAFLLFRSMLVPRCRLAFAQVVERAEGVVEGLALIAARHSARFVRLRPEWYGLDPIHIRSRSWRSAWREILCGPSGDAAPARMSWAEVVRVQCLRPERQWLFGLPQNTPQAGLALRRGSRVWLY